MVSNTIGYLMAAVAAVIILLIAGTQFGVLTALLFAAGIAALVVAVILLVKVSGKSSGANAGREQLRAYTMSWGKNLVPGRDGTVRPGLNGEDPTSGPFAGVSEKYLYNSYWVKHGAAICARARVMRDWAQAQGYPYEPWSITAITSDDETSFMKVTPTPWETRNITSFQGSTGGAATLCDYNQLAWRGPDFAPGSFLTIVVPASKSVWVRFSKTGPKVEPDFEGPDSKLAEERLSNETLDTLRKFAPCDVMIKPGRISILVMNRWLEPDQVGSAEMIVSGLRRKSTAKLPNRRSGHRKPHRSRHSLPSSQRMAKSLTPAYKTHKPSCHPNTYRYGPSYADTCDSAAGYINSSKLSVL